MSLTGFLKNPIVRKRFTEEFPKPTFKEQGNLLAPALTKRCSQNGTAFDYLFRFYLKHLNADALTQPWIAENGLDALAGRKRLHQELTKHLQISKQLYSEYLKNGTLSDELIEHALVLAKLDSVFRVGMSHPVFRPGAEGNDYRKDFLKADPLDVQDLKQLMSLVNPATFTAKELCILNPTFGRASRMIGSADADILMDDMLIEVKTVQALQLKADYLYQLIGYYCLHKLGHVKGSPRAYEIKKFGIYYSRYGRLWTIDAQEIIHSSKFPKFFQWFSRQLTTADTD